MGEFRKCAAKQSATPGAAGGAGYGKPVNPPPKPPARNGDCARPCGEKGAPVPAPPRAVACGRAVAEKWQIDHDG